MPFAFVFSCSTNLHEYMKPHYREELLTNESSTSSVLIHLFIHLFNKYLSTHYVSDIVWGAETPLGTHFSS